MEHKNTHEVKGETLGMSVFGPYKDNDREILRMASVS